MADRARGKAQDGPAALLWDNDGVLVDTEALYFDATGAVLADAGITLTREQFVEISLRRGASCFELAAEVGVPDKQLDTMRVERDRRYLELLGAGVPLIDGVREALAALHGRVPMAVVTSSKRAHFNAIHADSRLDQFFEFVLTAEDYDRFKPHPEPYLRAAARLEVEPAGCLVIEDTERGVSAAVAAGMRCVALPNGLSADGDFSAAWEILEGVHELPSTFERWAENASGL